MKQMAIPFKENADIPEAHFYAFRVCNSAGSWLYRQSFYQLKNDILEKYGHEADYDLQTIKKRCYTCNGTGKIYMENRCPNCINGVYSTKKVVLKRYVLNNAIFHKPMGELVFEGNLKVFNGYEDFYPTFKNEPFHGKIINKIDGLIKHEPMALHPVWAYYYLLFNYNREQFNTRINDDVKMFRTNTQYRLKLLLKKHNPLKALADFLEVKKEHLEPIDDLPF